MPIVFWAIGIFIWDDLLYKEDMKLSIIRHAQAIDFGTLAFDDARQLTEKGIKQSQSIGEYLLETGQVPEIVQKLKT